MKYYLLFCLSIFILNMYYMWYVSNRIKKFFTDIGCKKKVKTLNYKMFFINAATTIIFSIIPIVNVFYLIYLLFIYEPDKEAFVTSIEVLKIIAEKAEHNNG